MRNFTPLPIICYRALLYLCQLIYTYGIAVTARGAIAPLCDDRINGLCRVERIPEDELVSGDTWSLKWQAAYCSPVISIPTASLIINSKP